MRRTGSFVSRLFCACAALTFCASAAEAQTYTFTEGGFSEGATLSGSFTASDLDGDGVISYLFLDLLPEVTDFSASFSGNSLVAPFQLTYADLFVLGYDGSGVFGTPGFLGFYASDGDHVATTQFPDACDGTFDCAFVGGPDGVIDSSVVAPSVPEPATWGMMMLGFGLIGGALRISRRIAGRHLRVLA
jgi:hypothetical protein